MKNFIVIGAIFPFIAASSTAFGDFVVNGGFETGNFSGWTLNADPTVNYVDSGFAHTGSYAAFLGEPGDIGTLSQSLATTAGTSYVLSFWFAGSGDNPSDFSLSVGGSQLLNLINPNFDLNYVNYRYNFIATSAATSLTFGFRDDDGFLNLDDVSVVANVATSVPEPGSLALIGMDFFVITMIGAARLVVPRGAIEAFSE